jgi:hypothetical protein
MSSQTFHIRNTMSSAAINILPQLLANLVTVWIIKSMLICSPDVFRVPIAIRTPSQTSVVSETCLLVCHHAIRAATLDGICFSSGKHNIKGTFPSLANVVAHGPLEARVGYNQKSKNADKIAVGFYHSDTDEWICWLRDAHAGILAPLMQAGKITIEPLPGAPMTLFVFVFVIIA